VSLVGRWLVGEGKVRLGWANNSQSMAFLPRWAPGMAALLTISRRKLDPKEDKGKLVGIGFGCDGMGREERQMACYLSSIALQGRA
jgi:hypothetical protein